MNIIEYTTEWVKGEITQGKIMILLGVLFLVSCFLIWKYGNGIAKGMLIPMIVVILVYLGYGGHLVFNKPQQLQKMTIAQENNPQGFVQEEKARASKEKSAYVKFKITWAVVLIIGLVLLFFAPTPYLKGLALGLLFLGFSALLSDTFLEHRILTYYLNIRLL